MSDIELKKPTLSEESGSGHHDDHELDVQFRDHKLQMGSSFAASLLGYLCFPCTLAFGCFTLDPNEEAIQLNFGTYTAKYDEPGCHFSNCFGRELLRVSTREVSIDLPTIKVLDANGNPLLMSAIVVYCIVNPERNALAVEDADLYIANQATSTLRKIISEFPYETDDDSPSLKTHLSLVSRRLADAARLQLAPAGAEVSRFQVNELSYAPEIAAAMLKRQQALALVQARKVLVDGCAQIAKGAVERLEEEGIAMTDAEKVRIVSNIITVTCSDSETVNTINVGSTD